MLGVLLLLETTLWQRGAVPERWRLHGDNGGLMSSLTLASDGASASRGAAVACRCCACSLPV